MEVFDKGESLGQMLRKWKRHKKWCEMGTLELYEYHRPYIISVAEEENDKEQPPVLILLENADEYYQHPIRTMVLGNREGNGFRWPTNQSVAETVRAVLTASTRVVLSHQSWTTGKSNIWPSEDPERESAMILSVFEDGLGLLFTEAYKWHSRKLVYVGRVRRQDLNDEGYFGPFLDIA